MQKSMLRRGCILSLLLLGLFLVAALAAGPAPAQTTKPGPYYAIPSWDQTLPEPRRFIILSNFNGEAVLDRETGLVWEKTPISSLFPLRNARAECTSHTTGGRKGWRVPSVHELASLVDPANHDPALPTGHPFTNVQLDVAYWSGTFQQFLGSVDVWGVYFSGSGSVPGFFAYTSPLHVWCVRGGMYRETY
ncbi:DUF1566 domain-containing protein [Nitrospira sp. NS4]|uniref:Lcl C-terminal domain-containing protein n=1 Tax=Nitrospira sp. NS4 TaxID=3414498 RepID=UPI003C2CB294